MHISKVFILPIAVMTAGVVLAGCSQASPTPEPDSLPPVTESSAPGAAGTALEGSPEAMLDDTDFDEAIEIDMSNFKFMPNQITASPGEVVTVKLTNSDGFHDFVIEELDVASEAINAGAETMVQFTVPMDAAGETYEFYCSIGAHREQGMVGTLTITE